MYRGTSIIFAETNKLILKFTCKGKETRPAKTILKKKNKEFLGGPVVRTWLFHCWGQVQSLVGN